MKIGLIDVDGRNFPNLVLMKLSTYHKTKGDTIEFINIMKTYDVVYNSKVFTYSKDSDFSVSAREIIKDGAGYYGSDIFKKILPIEIEHIKPDYSLYSFIKKYKGCAFGFLTRGCPNKCNFCIVPEKEGNIKAYADIDDFLDNRKIAILMDNNVLASEHGLKQIEKIVDKKIRIDFNQGLDAKIIAENPDIAKLLSKVKWYKPLRMACDSKGQMEYVEKATRLLRKYGCTPKNYFIYVLVKNNIKDVSERTQFLIELKLKPFAQAYRDFDNKIKITQEQKDFCRFINVRKILLNSIGIDWKGYKRSTKEWKKSNFKKEDKDLF